MKNQQTPIIPIGLRIKAERERLGHTLRSAAAALGCTYETYRQVEDPARQPRYATIVRVVATLALDPVKVGVEFQRKHKRGADHT